MLSSSTIWAAIRVRRFVAPSVLSSKAAAPAALQPRLNPIEQVFAKLKHLMRKAAERTVETIWKRIGKLLDCFKPDEC